MKTLNRNKIALKFMVQLASQYNNSIVFTTERAFELADAFILETEKTEILKTPWNFVEEYFPNYSSSDEILHNNDLHTVCEGMQDDDNHAAEIYHEIKEELTELFGTEPEEFQILEIAQNKLNESNAYIYEKAIEGYLETLKK